MLRRLRKWWKDRRRVARERLLFERRIVVTVDGLGVSARYPDGTVQRARWDGLLRVVIETNDTGPWGADVWWILEGQTEKCVYPQGATGENEAMDAYKEKLPGFDWEAVIQASGSTSNASFLCWEKGRAARRD